MLDLKNEQWKIIGDIFEKGKQLKIRNMVLYDLATNKFTSEEFDMLRNHFDITYDEIMEEKVLWITE